MVTTNIINMKKVWMIFAFAVSSALSQFVCPDMFGMFRHPDNCSFFFVCNYGMAHMRSCPPNLHFDVALGICRHSSDVQCIHQTQLLTAGFTCSSSVGLFADPLSCEHFYLCANGHPYRQKCPFGLIFDGAVCNWKYDRSCRFQDRLRLRESINNQINEWPKDPQRPAKIDIAKIPKTSTQQIQDVSTLYSTLDETTISVSSAMTEEGKEEYSQRVKVPTVTPVERDITPLEEKNFTQTQEPLEETTENLQENENVTTQSPKMQSRWKELQRQQQLRRQQQQWLLQRQRQWRLHQRWKLQQQWRILQKTQRLQEQQRENKFLNGSFNGMTTSMRLMAGKATTIPSFTSRRLISNNNVSRKRWRPSWTEQLPRSEKKTSPPLLFPIRHKTHLPALIAIQAFGFKKSVNNSKDISNNSISSNFSIPNENDISKKDIINSFILDNTSNNTENNSIDDNHRIITDDNISKIYNDTHVINNITNNTISNNNNNISIQINNSSTYNKNNLNIDINSNNTTNTNLTTSNTMNNINSTFLNSNNSDNNTVLEREYENSTESMFVFRISENSEEKSDFSKPFKVKETTQNILTS